MNKKEKIIKELKDEITVLRSRPNKLFKIRTYYNIVVEGKNKRYSKDFVVAGNTKKDALLRFYETYGGNAEYVVKEIKPAEYEGK